LRGCRRNLGRADRYCHVQAEPGARTAARAPGRRAATPAPERQMTDAQPVSQDMIQAYVDDRLPADEARAVEAYLAQAPTDAARVAAYIDQRRQLRDALQMKFKEPIPGRLRVAEIRRMQRQRQTRRLTGLAAMLAIAVTAGIAGWIAAPHFGGSASD